LFQVLQPDSHRSPAKNEVDEEDDAFIPKEVSQKPVQQNADFGEVKEERDALLLSLKKEKEELFGLFPSTHNLDGKYIMISLELVRIHMRNLDYRNASKVMKQVSEKYP